MYTYTFDAICAQQGKNWKCVWKYFELGDPVEQNFIEIKET